MEIPELLERSQDLTTHMFLGTAAALRSIPGHLDTLNQAHKKIDTSAVSFEECRQKHAKLSKLRTILLSSAVRQEEGRGTDTSKWVHCYMAAHWLEDSFTENMRRQLLSSVPPILQKDEVTDTCGRYSYFYYTTSCTHEDAVKVKETAADYLHLNAFLVPSYLVHC